MSDVEQRHTTSNHITLRTNQRADNEPETVEFAGYATVYNAWYDVAGGPTQGGWREMIAAGAGTETLRRNPDVRLLVNHDGLPLARTTRGTMTLTEDDTGLAVHAPNLDLRNPIVQQLRSSMERGDVDEMSFAFRVLGQEWSEDYTERTILKYDLAVKGADVSIVTYPANEHTLATIRAAAGLTDLPVLGRGLSIGAARAMVDRIKLR